MRGVMIWVGIELISRFDWLLYGLGLLLLFAGIRMLFSKESGDPEKKQGVAACPEATADCKGI